MPITFSTLALVHQEDNSCNTWRDYAEQEVQYYCPPSCFATKYSRTFLLKFYQKEKHGQTLESFVNNSIPYLVLLPWKYIPRKYLIIFFGVRDTASPSRILRARFLQQPICSDGSICNLPAKRPPVTPVCAGEHPPILPWYHGSWAAGKTSNAEADSLKNLCYATCNAKMIWVWSISVVLYCHIPYGSWIPLCESHLDQNWAIDAGI